MHQGSLIPGIVETPRGDILLVRQGVLDGVFPGGGFPGMIEATLCFVVPDTVKQKNRCLPRCDMTTTFDASSGVGFAL